MAGIFCALVTLCVLSAVNQHHDYKLGSVGIGAVAMVFVHQAFYKMAAPTKDTYFMEISPFYLRPKTAVIAQFGDAVANILNGFVNPIGLPALGYRYYIIWICLVVSHFTIIYLFFPEVSTSSPGSDDHRLTLPDQKSFSRGGYTII